MVLKPLGSDLSSIIIAVKMQVRKINYYKINVSMNLAASGAGVGSRLQHTSLIAALQREYLSPVSIV